MATNQRTGRTEGRPAVFPGRQYMFFAQYRLLISFGSASPKISTAPRPFFVIRAGGVHLQHRRPFDLRQVQADLREGMRGQSADHLYRRPLPPVPSPAPRRRTAPQPPHAPPLQFAEAWNRAPAPRRLDKPLATEQVAYASRQFLTRAVDHSGWVFLHNLFRAEMSYAYPIDFRRSGTEPTVSRVRGQRTTSSSKGESLLASQRV